MISGLFKWLGTGYKKIWTEYSGIVELGIDVNKVSISKPDADGVVKITIPDAEMLDVDLDEESMSEPLTDTGFMTEITKEEETAALAEAQDNIGDCSGEWCSFGASQGTSKESYRRICKKCW